MYTGITGGRYNGNIAEIDWKNAQDGVLKRYTYQYDPLNRLLKGSYAEPNATVPQNNFYNEELSYDVNGNILNLKRNRYGANFGVELIDDLSYSYTGNTLNSITDISNNYFGYPADSGNIITYDYNGNMIKQEDQGLLQINYNHLNLPNYVRFNQFVIRNNPAYDTEETVFRNLTMLYRADGVKQKKIHHYFAGRTRHDVTHTTEYLDGFQYSTVENDFGTIHNNGLQFVPTAEGYFDFVQNKYIYQYKDQVGNVRLSFYNNGSGTAMIDRTGDFYPFGMAFGGESTISTFGSLSPNYLYAFQGQERQQETGWDSFKWRNYDPSMGRFFNVDPLSEKYAYQSHYNFSENRVVDGRELEGLEWVSAKNDQGVTTSRQLTVSITNSSTKLNDKQFNKLIESIKTDFSKTYGADGAKAELIVSDKATIKVDFVDLKGTPTVDKDGNDAVKFTGGVAGSLDNTQENKFSVTASVDGDKRSTGDMKRSFGHEAGHTAGLRHPFDPKQEVVDVKQGAPGVKTSTVTSNLMNSDANKINPSSSGTTLTTSQFKRMDELIQSQQPK
ncbi:RHS repeat-associated core domain-containing protein [Chryseobacterium lacus]|uniref:RHS repeat-associated core domain-containing protein n=1 Tax=Chryseobacterium lacus TaxID=2058346 RepID=UPI0011D10FCB|nr:RHS repeat-associated core domain-containing protein [Chryseobacterium lacus]